MVQVYHTNHKNTDTAYSMPACKSDADTNRAGFPVGHTNRGKNIVQVAKMGRAGIVNRGGGGV